MPHSLVFAALEETFPDCQPRIIKPNSAIEHPFVVIKRVECWIGDMIVPKPMITFWIVSRGRLPKSSSSRCAIRIRLEKLGLLMREVPHQPILGAG